MKLNSFFLFAKTFCLLPLLYFQGKKIRRTIPKLPEATGNHGVAGKGYDRTLRLVCMGESTIAGVGVRTHQDGFAGTLANRLASGLKRRIEWEVVARSGYTAKRVRHKLLPRITNQPQVIIVGLGGNDAFTMNKPANWADEIRRLIQDLKDQYPDAVIAFTNMPPIKIFPAFTRSIKSTIGVLVEILGKELELVVQEFDNVFYNNEILDLKNLAERHDVSGGITDFFSDGVHPSALTYQTWGKDFAKYLLTTVDFEQIGN